MTDDSPSGVATSPPEGARTRLPRGPLVRYWLSDFLGSFGEGLRLSAFPLLAARITHSPTAIASVVALQNLPWLFAPGIGVLVDRHDLRRLMVASQIAQVVTIAALTLTVITHACDLPVLYVATMITGISTVVRITATQAGTTRLVRADDLDRINGRLGAGELIGFELTGPAIAGLLFGIASPLPFALNAAESGIAALLLLTLPSVFQSLPRSPDAETDQTSALQELREGLSWIARSQVMRGFVATVAIVGLTDAAWFAILVLYVTRILHEGAGLYGLLLTVGAIGGVAASPACGWLSDRLGNRSVLVSTVIIMAAAQLILGLTSNLIVAAIMLACSSAALALFNATAVGVRQRIVPRRLIGRVSSAYLAVGGTSEALGAVLGGILASSAGIRAPMLVGAAPLVLFAFVLLIALRKSAMPEAAE